MKEKKNYITLRDREWKGKFWGTSFRSCKITRKLTKEEARPLLEEGTIQEIVPVSYEKDIVGVDGGRMFCKKCGNRDGFYIKKRPFGRPVEIFTCANCGVKEKRNLIN